MRSGQLTMTIAGAALVLFASVAFAIDTEPLHFEEFLEPEPASTGGVERARARLETLWIFDADFEDLTGDNAGWTSHDRSGTPFEENYWHHDTIRMQNFAWLEDSTWWCGTYNQCWQQPRGYGNNWEQILSRNFPEVALNTNPGDPLTLDFDQRYAMEHDYDYGYVDVSTNGGADWTTLHTVNNPGFSGKTGFPADWDDADGHVQLDLGAYAGLTVDLRFRFVSDVGLSPQDTPDNPPTSSMKDGAWQLDNITLTGPGGVFWADNCEDENMGWVHDDTQAAWQTGVTFERGQFGIDLFTGRDFTCDDRPVGTWMYAGVDDLTGKMVDWEWTWLVSPPIDIAGATKLVGKWDMWVDCPNESNSLFDLELAVSDAYECVSDLTGFTNEDGTNWYGGPFWGTYTDNWDAWTGNNWLAIAWEEWADAPDPGYEHMAGMFLNWQKVGIPVGDPGTTWETAMWDRFNDWFHEDLAQALLDTPRIRAYDDQGIESVYLRASNDGGETWNGYECLRDGETWWFRVPPPADLMTRGSEIFYYYEATDGAANTSVYPEGAPDVTGEFSILPIVGSTTDPGILLVDKHRRTVPGEDRSYSYTSQEVYTEALSRMGYDWDVFEVQNPGGSSYSHGPDTTGMKYYDTQIWFAAHNYSYALRQLDQYHLIGWLDQAAGGKERNLLLTGNNFGYALQPEGAETLDFFNTWLGSEFLEGAPGEITVDSLPGLYDYAGGYDFITDGGCILAGGCPVLGYFDVIGPAAGAIGAETVAEYERTDLVRKSAGVAYSHPTTGYQTVNLGFAMERMMGDLQPNGHFIHGGPHRRNLLGNIMNYFGKTPTLPLTYLVRADGTGDYPTIQAAINAAANGDTIELDPGIFIGVGNSDLDYTGKAIWIRSAERDPETCIIDCQFETRGVTFDSGEGPGSVFEYITIRNGDEVSDFGGAVYCGTGTSPTIVGCKFEGNYALYGGGIFCTGASPELTGCMFVTNSSNIAAGGAMVTALSSPTFLECSFWGNTGATGGAIVCSDNSSVALTGCLVISNIATGDGGGIAFGNSATVSIESCTFSLNEATNGSAVHLDTSSDVTIDHTIVAFGTGDNPVYCDVPTNVSLTCSDVYGNVGGDYVGAIAGQNGINGNISADPRFCGPYEGDYHIHHASPCVDVVGCELIGAMGIGCGQVWHVPGDVPTITAAMDSAAVGDTVIVATGVYEEYNIPMESGVVLRSETGELAGATIYAAGQGAAVVCADVDSTAVLKGFVIIGGSESGIVVLSGSPRIVNCLFDSNSSGGEGSSGGGMYCDEGSAPELVDCVFSGNTATERGGGLFCYEASPFLTGCVFEWNVANQGGAIWADPGSSLYLSNCTLSQNEATSGTAGGIGLSGTLSVDIANTIIANSISGEAIYCDSQEFVNLTCCDIYGNFDGDYTGCIEGYEGVDGNFSEDPVFCGPENPLEPYALRSDSPCAAHNNPGCWWIGAYELGCISYVDWDAGGDGTDWSDPLNWDPDQVPAAGDHARIQLDGTYSVEFDDRAEIWALTHGAATGTQTLDIVGGTLTVSHGARNTSAIIVRDPGAIDADASMSASVITNEIGATVTLEDGDLVGSGSFENSGTVTKTGLGRSSLAVSFVNEAEGRGGGLVEVDAGSLSVDGNLENNGRVAVNTGGTAIVSSHFLGREVVRATVTSSGEIEVDGSLVVNGEFENSGRVAVNTGGTTIVSSFFVGRELLRGSATNSGVIEVDGDLDVAGDFENVGRVAVNTGGTAIVSSHFTDREPRAGSFVNAPAGTISVDGSLEVDGGMENNGRVAVNTGGTAIVSSHFADTRLPQAGFDNPGAVSIAAGGSFTTTGTGGITSSGTFETSGTVWVETGGTFANIGTAEVGIGGDFYVDGSVSNEDGANFSNFGRTMLGGQGDITNSGFFHHRENAVLGGSGTFDTQTGLTTLKGIISPGASYGTLSFYGDFVQTGASQLHLEIGGTMPGTEYDRLEISGNADLGGAVSLAFDPEFVPVVGDSFDVIVLGGLLRGAGRDTSGFGCFSGLDISDTLHIEPVEHPDKFQFVAVEGTTGNAAPLAADDADSVVGYQPIMIPVLDNDSDPDVDELRIIDVLTDGTAGLAYVDVGDYGVTFAAALGFEGDDFFDYVITDCMGGVDTARVTIGVTAPPRTLRVPDDYATIAGGIAAASAGDTVLIACGTYQESDISIPSGIILVSETGDPDCVVIDASGRLGRGLVFTNVDTTTVVRGLTITGGTAGDYGGGMYFTGSSPRVEDCVLTGNSALYGGGIWCENASSPTLTRCLFTDNEAIIAGGGVGCETSAAPTLVSCTLTGNSATNGSGIAAGGGAVVTVDRTIISFGVVGEAALCTTGATVTLTCSDVYTGMRAGITSSASPDRTVSTGTSPSIRSTATWVPPTTTSPWTPRARTRRAAAWSAPSRSGVSGRPRST